MSTEKKNGTAAVDIRTSTQKFPAGSIITTDDVDIETFNRLVGIGGIVLRPIDADLTDHAAKPSRRRKT